MDEPDKFITQNVEPRTLTIKELKKSIREIKSVLNFKSECKCKGDMEKCMGKEAAS